MANKNQINKCSEIPDSSDSRSLELFKQLQSEIESYCSKIEEEKNKRIEKMIREENEFTQQLQVEAYSHRKILWHRIQSFVEQNNSSKTPTTNNPQKTSSNLNNEKLNPSFTRKNSPVIRGGSPPSNLKPTSPVNSNPTSPSGSPKISRREKQEGKVLSITPLNAKTPSSPNNLFNLIENYDPNQKEILSTTNQGTVSNSPNSPNNLSIHSENPQIERPSEDLKDSEKENLSMFDFEDLEFQENKKTEKKEKDSSDSEEEKKIIEKIIEKKKMRTQILPTPGNRKIDQLNNQRKKVTTIAASVPIQIPSEFARFGEKTEKKLQTKNEFENQEKGEEEKEKFVRPDFLAINTYRDQVLSERRMSFTNKIYKENPQTKDDEENEFALYDVPHRRDKNIF